MKRSALVVTVCAVLVVPPAAAQWTGMPVWNDPKGGTGITISGDYGKPNDNYGGGNAWGGRAALGVGTVTLTAGGATHKPQGSSDATTGVAASQTKFGYALGANLTFGMLGVHLAYDYQKLDVGSTGVFGVGAHLDIRAPGGF